MLRQSLCTAVKVGGGGNVDLDRSIGRSKRFQFFIKFSYVMSKELSGELSSILKVL